MTPPDHHEPPTPRRVAKLALTLVAVVGAGGAAYAFGAPVVAGPGGESAERQAVPRATRPPGLGTLMLYARVPRRTVAPGGRVAYALRVHRGRALIVPRDRGRRREAAPVRLRVVGPLRAGISARLHPRATRSASATLTVRTTRRIPDGTYRVRLEARGRLRARPGYRTVRARTVVTLVVRAPGRHRFTIHGTLPGDLSPGVSMPIDLRLTNPHRYRLRIRRLEVRVTDLRLPRTDAARPCTAADFATVSFSDPRGIVLPASSTRTLSALGVTASRWPRVGMVNRPVNQDGCKHARLTLGFSGVATKEHR